MSDRLYGDDRLIRHVDTDIEIRADGEGRTVYGMLVPFDTPTQIGGLLGGYEERFAHGAFAKSINDGAATRAKLTVGHRLELLPIGRVQELREDPAGLVGSFYVSKTVDGDDALQRIRDGAVDSFSIEFQPIRSEWNQDRTAVTRREAKLLGASLVAYPAYESALVSGVRSVAAVADTLDRWPDLMDQIRSLVESRLMEHLEDPTDAATEGTSDGSDDTPTPIAGHLSDQQQRAIDDLKARLSRLYPIGDTSDVGEDR